MKKITTVVMLLTFVFSSSGFAAAEAKGNRPKEVPPEVADQQVLTPEQESRLQPTKGYFDEQFGKLQQSVAEVKGDTTQIVSILGNVFEGTVPKGGTLTGLCNKNGWNLIVLMGHNGISNPNAVSAGATFEYPRTGEEFQAALKKGKPLYDEWLAQQKTTFRVNRVKVDTAEIDELNLRVVHIKEKLKIKDMEVDRLKVRLAEITEKLRIKELEVERAKFGKVDIDQLHIRQLQIDNLKDLLAQAQGRISALESRPPKVVEREVVTYRDAGGATVATGSCNDNPWPATYFWNDFPDGAVGTETQLRDDPNFVGYKYKLVQRRGDTIYATKCFKDTKLLSLSQLSVMWNVPLTEFRSFGNTGDGGKHATILVGIAN